MTTRNLQIEYSGTNPVYIGDAPAGSATSALAWTIYKLTYDGNNNVLSRTYAQSGAQGIASNKCAWDNRAAYTYS